VDSQREAQRLKRLRQQKKFEEEEAAFQEELSLEMYTLETPEGDMWGPHSYEALADLVERCAVKSSFPLCDFCSVD
jgi:hypothetical protein